MAAEWIEGRDPGDERDETPEPRFFVDARIGCVAVIDRDLRDPEYPGLHPDTPGVVRFWSGARDAEGAWMVPEEAAREARALCERLNSEPETPEVAGGEREVEALGADYWRKRVDDMLSASDASSPVDAAFVLGREYGWAHLLDLDHILNEVERLALLSARPAPEREPIVRAREPVPEGPFTDEDVATLGDAMEVLAEYLVPDDRIFARLESLQDRVGRLRSRPEPVSEPEPAPGAEPVADPRSAYMNLRTCICGEDASEHTAIGCSGGFDPEWRDVRSWLERLAHPPTGQGAEALRPFVEFARMIHPDNDDADEIVVEKGMPVLNVGHFRALLAASPAPSGGETR